jgi:hypothetical protein
MKQYAVTLFCFFLLLSNSVSSQSLLWAKQLSGTSWKNVNDMTVDKDGNVYSTGIFQDVVDFDPGPATFNLNTIGSGVFSGDIFVSKLDSAGNFVWAKKMGGPEIDLGAAITHDVDGNIYVTGGFRNTADFDPGPGIYNMTAAGNTDVFVVKPG